MTKQEFKEWLQERIDDDPDEDKGDTWREIESAGLLDELGIPYAWDYQDQCMYFLCSDGLLVSTYELGPEGETVWFFANGDVGSNMRHGDWGDVDDSLKAARVAVYDLEMLRGKHLEGTQPK
jgi:hypothetical protein